MPPKLFDLILTVLFHELAHIAAAAACGAPVRSAQISGTGFVLRHGFSGYRDDLIVAAAGPLVNITLSIIFSSAAKCGILSESAYYFAGLNLLTALYNLIPALPMDGGVILFSILAQKLEYSRACRISGICALISGLILMILGIDIVVKTRYNITILAGSAMIIGGYYAQGAGKDLTEGHKARKILGR